MEVSDGYPNRRVLGRAWRDDVRRRSPIGEGEMMRWLIEFAKDVHAKRRHEWHEEMDLITSGQHGYWKRDPYWPRKPA